LARRRQRNGSVPSPVTLKAAADRRDKPGLDDSMWAEAR
jgi:hypothetical protein